MNFFNRGLYKEAIEWFDRTLKIKPDDCSSLRNKGISLVWLGRYKEAIECYDRALKVMPDDYDSLRCKGIALFCLERCEEAIKCYDRALKIKPDDYDSLRNKGISLFQLKRYREAIECYDRALKFKPDDYDSLREKGVALSCMEMYKESIKFFDRALKIKPDDYNSLRRKGASLHWLKRYKEAIEYYDQALKIKPDDYDSLKGKGIALGFLGMYKEAIESLDQGLKIKPDDYQSLEFRDNILEKMKDNRDIKIKKEDANETKQDGFKYDIALSFAGENREIVEQVAEKLAENNIQVFYDEYEKAKLWGKRLSTHFQKTYGENTCFVLVFVSKEYSLKDWTNFEFSIARGEAKVRGTEFILPVRLDNTPLFGLPDDMAYLDFNTEGIEGIVSAVIAKLKD